MKSFVLTTITILLLLNSYAVIANETKAPKELELTLEESVLSYALAPQEYNVVERMYALSLYKMGLNLDLSDPSTNDIEDEQEYYNQVCLKETCVIINTEVISEKPVYSESSNDDFIQTQYGVSEVKLIFKDPKVSKKWQIRYLNVNYVDADLGELLSGEGWKIHRPASGLIGVEVGRFIFESNDKKNKVLLKLGLNHHSEVQTPADKDFYSAMVGIEYQRIFKVIGKRVRITFTEGQSYSQEVPWYEGIETARDNDGRMSKKMNFLGFTIGLNLGDLFGVISLEDCYLESYIWHRSGIFATQYAYNNIKGGSNFVGASTSCSF